MFLRALLLASSICALAVGVDFSGITLDGPDTTTPFDFEGFLADRVGWESQETTMQAATPAPDVLAITTAQPTTWAEVSAPADAVVGSGESSNGMLAAILIISSVLLVSSMVQCWVVLELRRVARRSEAGPDERPEGNIAYHKDLEVGQ
ncbi:hypothetical protein FOL47_005862 [Perkinsus chesapeaki]|uniref:Transmembrane protein n=1 Tax=Perkinsus chesapeaki TaxID=330153 RepID=A0A7J6LWN5_PERCH|nr:hypothetical protein FOL47_005862 [Perkinsus chesapeaki]